MDLTFSDEQTMLRGSVSRLLAQNYSFDQRRTILASSSGTSPKVWRQFGELGLLALPFPEEAGGVGGSISDVVAIAEPFGRHLVCEPYLSSVLLAGRALATSPDSAVAGEWLDRIVTGTAQAAFAHEEGRGTPDPAAITTTACDHAGGVVVSGEKRLVFGASDADVVVVTVRVADDRLGLVLVTPDLPGFTLTPFRTVDGRSAAHCRFDDVRVPRDHLISTDALSAISSVIDFALVALAGEGVGIMTALLDATVAYAASREQFGVPIASFQALGHRLADMKIAVLKARSTLLWTTALVESGRATPRDVSLLKAQVGRLGRAVAESAVQIHGGIAMTDEIVIGHYLKRILAIDAMFGSGEYHYRRVGSA